MEKFPKLAVDILVAKDDKILLIKRKYEPFKGKYALPGGFVEYGETVEQAAVRECKEETGIDVELEGLLGVYSAPDRDPRGHVISIVFFGIPKKGKPTSSNETEDVGYRSLKEIENMELASDHETIIEDFKIIHMSEEGNIEKR
ncbi:TPA: NUDIX hydrolase [archaeon]|nr:NUDIX hydrolase [Candidatus Naiadarchaeales archaeon SRR2090159.bin1288]